MKAKLKQITLAQIAEAVSSKPLDEARAEIAETIINISEAKVLKVIKRELPGNLRLHLGLDNGHLSEVFANFPTFTEQSKILKAKVRKGSRVSLSGTLRSFGLTAVVLNDCRLLTERAPAKRVTKGASSKALKYSTKASARLN